MDEYPALGSRPPAWKFLSLLLITTALTLTSCAEDPMAPAGAGEGPRSDIRIGDVDPLLPTTTDTDVDGLSDTEEETLLRQYRPMWYFDGQEFVFPISVGQWGLATGSIGPYRYWNLPSLKDAVYRNSSGTMTPTEYFIVGDREEDAPIYVDAVPMPRTFTVDGKRDLVWLHYYLLFGEDAKLILLPFGLRHRGDWEHICVLVERAAAGNKNRRPVRLHFHHHGQLDVSSSAYAWHRDGWGNYHPRVYVEAGAHGMYRNPGQGPVGPHASGAGSPDNPLDNPMRFMTSHWSSRRGTSRDEKDILQRFKGTWGDTAGSPRGPLQYNSACDHDYRSRPFSSSFRLSDC